MIINFYYVRKLFFFIVLLLFSLDISGQSEDCLGAEVVCVGESYNNTPTGGGADDFNDPDNDPGCITLGEHESIWLYFEFDASTPPNSELTFVIDPFDFTDDYDFALYGPNVSCDNLGSPIRCSFSADDGPTGLSTGSNDTTEDAFGDAFVSEIYVNPGEGYYLFVDNFSSSSSGFDLNWAGAAANFIDCNPGCTLAVTLPPDMQVCEEASFSISSTVTDGSGSETYVWTGAGGEESFMDDATSPNPQVTLPIGFSGSIVYTLTVTDGSCVETASITISTFPSPVPNSGNESFCNGADVTLDAGGGFSSYAWSTGAGTQTIVVSSTGTYDVTVTDGNFCTGVGTFTVTQSPPVSVDINGDLNICVGGNTALTATTGFSNYVWSTGEMTESITVSSPGTYEVTVTDGNSCTGSASVVVTEVNLPPITIAQNPNFLCPGSSVQLDAGGGFSSYSWSTGATSAVIDVSLSGLYSVTVENADGCTQEGSITVVDGAAANPSISGNLVICQGMQTTLTVTGGTFNSYIWSTGEQTSSINVSTSGNYAVTVTNSDGCDGEAQAAVSVSPPPVPQISGGSSLCAGDSETLQVAGNYQSYIWSTGDNGAQIQISSPGTYSVTVMDANGCEGSADFVVQEASSPTPSIVGNLSFCEGEDTQLSLSNAYNSYLWSNGDMSPSIVVSSPGTYSVTVTNAEGCHGTTQVVVTELPRPSPQLSGPASLCAGGVGEAISVAGSYSSYLWNTGDVSPSIFVNNPGTYSVTVTDGDGCTGSSEWVVLPMPPLSPEITGDLSFCFGDFTILSVGNYDQILWSDGTTGNSVDVFSAGSVSVTVSDANGCTGSDEVIVTTSIPPAVEIMGSEELCEGATEVLQTDGNYASYEWSTGEFSPSITISEPGEYWVTVTDENGCTGIDDIYIQTQVLPNLQIMGSTSFCSGSQTTLFVEDIYAQYEWSNGLTSSSIDVTVAGTYSVTVTNENGCTATQSVVIEEQTALSPTISGMLSFCEGGETILSAGIGYDNYLWSDGSTSSTLTVTEPGTYSVTVSDVTGCSGNTSVTVIQNNNPVPQIIGVDTICTGTTTQLSLADVYESYIWSTGDVTERIDVVGDNSYSVTVTDTNGCEGSNSHPVATWNNPTPTITGELSFCSEDQTILQLADNYPVIEWSNGSNSNEITVSTEDDVSVTVTDENGCIGSAQVTTSFFETNIPEISGSLVYCPDESTTIAVAQPFVNYLWSNGDTTSTTTISADGNVSVTVTDEHGCQTTNTVLVQELNINELTFTGRTSFCEGEAVTIGLADEFATYEWSTGATTASIEVSLGGIYSVTVGLENGCTATSSINIVENSLPDVQIGGSTSYCVGSSTTLNAGASYSEYQWSTGDDTYSIVVADANTYSLTVTDENGCTSSASVDVIQDNALHPVISGDLAFCENSSTVLDAGAGFADYQWSNGAGTQTIEVNAPGLYQITVTDAGGCFGEASVEVAENPLPNPVIFGEFEFCAGESTTIGVDAGFASFEWSTGDDLPTTEVSAAGLYQVTVTNEFGCQNIATQEIIERELPVFEIAGQDYFCAGSETIISGVEGMVGYQWSNGLTTEEITVDNPGTYQLQVTDSFGCHYSDEISIEKVALPDVPIGDNKYLDCDTGEVSLGADLSEVNPNWIFHWEGDGINPSSANDLNPIATSEGTYSLTVEDLESGCVSETQNVEVIDLSYTPDVSIIVLDTLNCYTEAVRLNTYSDPPLSGAVKYQWYKDQEPISGADNDFFYAEDPGLYGVIVLDTLTACSGQDEAEVIENMMFPIADAGDDALLDCNIMNVSIGSENSQQGPGIVYSWETIEGNQDIFGNREQFVEVSEPGLYQLTVQDTLNGCENVDTVLVEQDREGPIADAGSDQTIDCHSEEVVLDGSNSARLSNSQFEWYHEGSDSLLFDGVSWAVNEPGTYQLVVTNADNGCSDTDEVIVLVDDNYPRDIEVVIDDVTCYGDADGSLSVTDVVGDDEGPFIYSINGQAFTSSPVFEHLEAGTYTIGVQNPEGCEYEEEFTIEEGNVLDMHLDGNHFILLGDTAQIKASVDIDSDEIASLVWITADSIDCIDLSCLSVSTSPLQTTDYQLTVVDENGCKESDKVTVFVKSPREIYVPSGFSPNGDGVNDVAMIYAGKDVAYVRSFLIFNRWGENVFEAYDFPPNIADYGWKGTHKGRKLNAAVFVYSAEVVFIDGETTTFKGGITLVR